MQFIVLRLTQPQTPWYDLDCRLLIYLNFQIRAEDAEMYLLVPSMVSISGDDDRVTVLSYYDTPKQLLIGSTNEGWSAWIHKH